jgi:hypothetical protein
MIQAANVDMTNYGVLVSPGQFAALIWAQLFQRTVDRRDFAPRCAISNHSAFQGHLCSPLDPEPAQFPRCLRSGR